MDKQILEQYIELKREARDLEQRIERLNSQPNKVEFGTVKGSSKNFPYTERTFTVSGYNICDLEKRNNKIRHLRKKYEEKLEECLEQQVEIEEFINSIKDSRIRQILRYKYIDGLSWIQIGHRMGSTADACRMCLDRHLEKN